MSIRLVTNEVLRLDVDIESYNRIVKQITTDLTPMIERHITQSLTNKILDDITERVINNFDIQSIEYRVSQHLEYGRIVEYIKTPVADLLITNERFKTLITRNITATTNGVIDETIERVIARMTPTTTNEGDI